MVDPHPASTRLVSELLKDLGARSISIEPTASRAMSVARTHDPQLILTEFAGPSFEGPLFVRELRRSDYTCRQVPVIMITAEATAAAIMAARDAGVHEFLRKPFTIKDLVKRVEAVTLRNRDWVEALRYIGPDRRRFNSGDYKGALKRRSDAPTPHSARVEQALRILRSAMQALASDPKQAIRAMQAQAADLTSAAVSLGDTAMATAAAGLSHCLQEAIESGVPNRPRLEAACLPLWIYLPADSEKAA